MRQLRFAKAAFCLFAMFLLGSPAQLEAMAQDNTTRPPEGLRSNVPSVYALTGATAHTAPGRAIENAVIVIRGEKIVDIGPAGEVEIPGDARVVDLSGRTVYAGFVDAYTEQDVDRARLDEGAPYWNSNITPQLSVADQFSMDDDLNEDLREQGVVARLVAPANGIIRGRSVVALTSDEAADRAIVAADSALHIRLTVSRSFGSGGGPSYPNSPMGAVALARQSFYDAIWYRDAWAAVTADSQLTRPERNDALEALQQYLDGEQLVVLDGLNELYALRADRYAREFSLRAAILGSGNEYRRLDAIRETKRPVIVPLNFPSPPDVSTEQIAASVSLESMMHWDLAPENPGRLANAGVQIALTSNGLDSKGDFIGGVQTAVTRGLDQEAALAALTTTPAEMFGVDELLGTIAPGKLACLVVADGNLFESGAKVEETWVRGIRYAHESSPQADVTGHWEMELEYATGTPNRFIVDVSGEGAKLSGEIRTSADDDAKSTRLDALSLGGWNIKGSFPGYIFDQDGVARFSAIVGLSGDSWVARGHLVWPNGKRVAIRISPTTVDEEAVADATEETDSESDDEAEAIVEASFDVNYPLGAYGVASPATPVRRLVIRNATIWTCGPDGILEDADLLIGDGKILAVGTDLEVSADVAELDGSGMHVSPGIIDCHSHMASDGGINESGQTITAEVRIGDFINCDDISIYRQLAGGVTSSNILHGSANPIGGQNQVIKLRWGMIDEAMKFKHAPGGIKFALGENVKRSRSPDSTRYPSTRMGVEQIMRDEFHAAERYLDGWRAWNTNPTGMPPRRDLELDAIAECLEGTRWIHCHSYRQDEILALIRTLDDFGITIGTFQHILEGYKVAEAMAEHGAMASAFSDWWAYKMEVYDAIPFAGALMHEAGIVVSFNSDDSELATHLNLEAAKAVKYGGVSPEEALKFVTLNPAKQLRIDEHVGSIEVGKDADFVLWSGSPLSNFSRCEQTWVDGTKFFDRELDQQSRVQIAEQRNVLIQKILASGQKMRPRGSRVSDPSTLWPNKDLFCKTHQDGDDGWYLNEYGVHVHRNWAELAEEAADASAKEAQENE